MPVWRIGRAASLGAALLLVVAGVAPPSQGAGDAVSPAPAGSPQVSTGPRSQRRSNISRSGKRVPKPPRYYDMVLVVPPAAAVAPKRNLLQRPSSPLRPFYVDEGEVSVKEYAAVLAYLANQGVQHPSCHPDEPPGKSHVPDGWELQLSGEAVPVVGVDWFDAWAHCRARGARMLTGDEWEVAGTEGESRTFPWGERWEAERVCCCGACPLPEPGDSRPSGATSAGVRHLLGNVWEWTTDFPLATNRAEDAADRVGDARLIRGGSFASTPPLSLATWEERERLMRAQDVGFRCAR